MRVLQRIVDLDSRISNCLTLRQSSHLCRLPLLALAHSGDSPLWLLLSIIICLTAKSPVTHTGPRLLAGILGAGITTTALKWTFRRRRPPGSSRGFYWKHDQHALPSGHAGRTACIVAILAAQTDTLSVIALTVWMVAVGASRVSLGVHFALDIVTGWVVGFAIGYLVCVIIP